MSLLFSLSSLLLVINESARTGFSILHVKIGLNSQVEFSDHLEPL
jgi:hypothetical protein